MKAFARIALCILFSLTSVFVCVYGKHAEKSVFLISIDHASARIYFGEEKLAAALERIGYKVVTGNQPPTDSRKTVIYQRTF